MSEVMQKIEAVVEEKVRPVLRAHGGDLKVDRLEGRSVVSQGISHPILDGVAVYEFREDEYYLSNLDRVSSGYQLTAWYDKTAARGGGVRVIVAKELP